MTRGTFVIAAVLFSCACGSSSTPTRGAETGANLRATCVAFFTHQRECADLFVPQLVALRVRHDRPQGIAERDRSEGREALLTVARREYEDDSTDHAIEDQCDAIVAEAGEAAADFEHHFHNCTQLRECSEFVPCDLALLEAHWREEDAARTPQE